MLSSWVTLPQRVAPPVAILLPPNLLLPQLATSPAMRSLTLHQSLLLRPPLLQPLPPAMLSPQDQTQVEMKTIVMTVRTVREKTQAMKTATQKTSTLVNSTKANVIQMSMLTALKLMRMASKSSHENSSADNLTFLSPPLHPHLQSQPAPQLPFLSLQAQALLTCLPLQKLPLPADQV